MRNLRVHYVVLWVLLLALVQARSGIPRAGLDDALVVALLALGFPATILAGAALSAIPADPAFWNTRLGITLGWAAFFAAGTVQWLLLVPWVIRKIRKK